MVILVEVLVRASMIRRGTPVTRIPPPFKNCEKQEKLWISTKS
jgi:hypothetical protein